MQVRRILVPVDGSELTDKAIAASVGLARQLGASITGFVALQAEPKFTGGEVAGWMGSRSPDPDEMTAGEAQHVLERFADAAREAGVPFDGVTDRVARVDRAIIAAAESHNCDLILMVTHGRGAFGEFLFGSQTKAVLAGSRLPLLVLH